MDRRVRCEGHAVERQDTPVENTHPSDERPIGVEGGVLVHLAYALPEAGRVRLGVFDALGRAVTVLVDGHRPPGRYEATFDASRLPAGVYVARLDAGGEQRAIPLTLVR